MPPAARIGDLHTCPMSDGPKPHVGGPIAVGCPTVLIGGMPAARVGDMAICVGPPDMIAKGSTGVFIGGMPAARMGDMTVHGGVITVGFPTVMIGEVGGPPKPSGGSSLFDLLGAFAEGVWDSISIKDTIIALAAQAALMALGLNPAFAVAAMAIYGAYSLYQGLKEAGDGDASKGAEKAWDAFVNGSDEDKAYVAGYLTGTLATKRPTKKLTKATKKLARKARKLEKLKKLKNSKTLQKINSKTHGGTKAGKAAKAVDNADEKFGDVLTPGKAGDAFNKKKEKDAKKAADNTNPSQSDNQGTGGAAQPQGGNDQPDVMTISSGDGPAQNFEVSKEDQIWAPAPKEGGQ